MRDVRPGDRIIPHGLEEMITVSHIEKDDPHVIVQPVGASKSLVFLADCRVEILS